MSTRSARQLRRDAQRFGAVTVNPAHPNVLEFRAGLVRAETGLSPARLTGTGLAFVSGGALIAAVALLPDSESPLKRGIWLGVCLILSGVCSWNAASCRPSGDTPVRVYGTGTTIATMLAATAKSLDDLVRDTPDSLADRVLPVVATLRADLLTLAAAAEKQDPHVEEQVAALRSSAQQIAGLLVQASDATTAPELLTDPTAVAGLLESLQYLKDHRSGS